MKNLYRLLLLFSISTSMYSSASAQCIANTHSPFENQGWLSCATSTSPNPDRSGHWLLYDLGHSYAIDSTYLWNHNVWGETEHGVKEIYIDYSDDMISWKTLGPYLIDEAPGSWKYNTPQGLWMGDACGRYFLVSVVDTWSGEMECAGFGELKFTLKIKVDVEENEIAQSWSIAPNPSSDFIDLDLRAETEQTRISILNGIGQEVETVIANAGQKRRIDVQDYENGIYFVRIQRDGLTSTKSFVKVN